MRLHLSTRDGYGGTAWMIELWKLNASHRASPLLAFQITGGSGGVLTRDDALQLREELNTFLNDQRDLATVQYENNNLYKANLSLHRENEALREEAAIYDQRIAAYQEENEMLRERNRNQELTIISLQKERDDDLDHIREDFRTENRELGERNATKRRSIISLQNENETLRQRVASLEKDNADLQTKLVIRKVVTDSLLSAFSTTE